MSSTKVVGVSIPRVDGRAKVSGTARYVDDLKVDGMLHGATVRSRIGHGELLGIAQASTFDWSDIVVVTAEDIPGENTIALIENDQPALVAVGDMIRHPDEPVALVAAPTRERAMAAREHIELSVREHPGVYTIEDAIAADVVLYGEDNVFKSYEISKGRGDQIEEVLASCDVVIEGTYRTPAQEQMYIEPQGMLAEWRDGTCYIVGSLQCPYYVHAAMKPLLGLGDDDIVVSQAVTGGGFGGKEEYPSMIAAHAALLARKARAPVKLVYDRDEDIAATTKRHPSRVHHRLGINRDGTIVACAVDVVLDGGAYLTLTPVVLSRAVLHASGPYRIENVHIRGRAVATNLPPHGAFRGFGAPQTTFAYERQIEKAAKAIDMGAEEFRRKNLLEVGDETATSQRLTNSVASHRCLDAIVEAAGDRPRPSTEPNRRRGRGLCTYFHGAGFTGSGEQRLAGRATVALVDGGRFEVRSSSTDIGQGAQTMFASIASTALGVDVSLVETIEPSTDRVPDSGPTVASRTCMVVGGLVDRAAKNLRRRIEEWATKQNVSGDIAERARSMAESEGEVPERVQYEPPPGIVWDDATYTGSAYPTYGWAACLVDLTVDLDTFEVEVDRCIQAVDVGKAIHPVIVKGQIEGGTLQALGWALWENVVYDRGRVLNDRMTNCIVPTFADAPELETIIVEEPYPYGPYGAKGVGEIPMDGPAAAVANALANALGVELDELPCSPESISRAVVGATP